MIDCIEIVRETVEVATGHCVNRTIPFLFFPDYSGLSRDYECEDAKLAFSLRVKIYGRDKEIEDLSQKILYNAQTVIYGRSGIGKSSILKAGVFPILRRNDYFPVYVRFVHDTDHLVIRSSKVLDSELFQ